MSEQLLQQQLDTLQAIQEAQAQQWEQIEIYHAYDLIFQQAIILGIGMLIGIWWNQILVRGWFGRF